MMPDKRFAAGWALIEELQKSPNRWHVRFIVATDSGLRVRHEECCINAPDQFAAVLQGPPFRLVHVPLLPASVARGDRQAASAALSAVSRYQQSRPSITWY